MPVGLAAQGGRQSLLLLLQCRPKIGEHSGHDTKTGLMYRFLGFLKLEVTGLLEIMKVISKPA